MVRENPQALIANSEQRRSVFSLTTLLKMKLLDPYKIKKEKSKTDEESRQRSSDLAKEESRIAKAINLTRQKYQEGIKEMEEEFKKNKIEIARKKAVITNEVKILEEKKKEAIKPLDSIKRDLEKKGEDIENKKIEIDKEKELLNEERERNIEIGNEIKDRKDDLKDLEETLNSRDKKVVAEEDWLKQSSKILKTGWVKFHEATNLNNKKTQEIAKKEADLKISEKATEARKKQQDERQKEQDNKDIQIRDKYSTLQKAQEEILGKTK